MTCLGAATAIPFALFCEVEMENENETETKTESEGKL